MENFKDKRPRGARGPRYGQHSFRENCKVQSDTQAVMESIQNTFIQNSILNTILSIQK